MKKSKMFKNLVILLCLIIVFIILLIYQNKKLDQAETEIISTYYRQQNRTLPQITGTSSEETFIGYDEVDEAELYVSLAAYNEYIELNDMDAQKLSIDDFKDYLSNEYDEDGNLRIYKKYRLSLDEFISGEYDISLTPMYDTYKYVRYEKYPHIYSYVDWYYNDAGKEYIQEYWVSLDIVIDEYRLQELQTQIKSIYELNVQQIQELIKKKNNPDYKIKKEVMVE